MPPSIAPGPLIRVCAFRPKVSNLRAGSAVTGVKRPTFRTFAEDKSKDLPKAPPGTAGPNTNPQEHVSEEAAKIAKAQGQEGPDIEGHGTHVQEILRDEKDIRKQAPQVMKEQAKSGQPPSKPSTRPFSTLARRQMEIVAGSSGLPALDPSILHGTPQQAVTAAENLAISEETKGHKFPLPTLPLPIHNIKTKRQEPIVLQVTNLMMRDGKKALAQRNMSTILNILRTSPSPTYNPTRPLLPGAPPASHLPLNPVIYLTLAIDSVAPLVRVRNMRGMAGGGLALPVPMPLAQKQRRRQAFVWILEAASKRSNRGSGRDMFATKVAEELIAVVEGRSTVWERRNAVHKMGTTARSNLSFRKRGGRR